MIFRSVVYYLIVCALQYWWGEHFRFFGLSLDFSFMACVSSVSLFSPVHSLVFSFFLGFFSDFSSWGHFGLYCLSYTLISYSLISLRSRADFSSGFSRNILFFSFFYLNILFYSLFYFAIYKNWFFSWKDFIAAPFLNLLFFWLFYEISDRYLSVKKCL